MNIIEVSKKENIGKSYEIFIDGESNGVWEIKNGFNTEEFDFYRDGEPLEENYFASQITRMEFEEVVDWSKIPVDTKVLVSNNGEKWDRRYFAKYESGKIYCFAGGKSSFSANDVADILCWEYAKLYQE